MSCEQGGVGDMETWMTEWMQMQMQVDALSHASVVDGVPQLYKTSVQGS